MRYALVRGHQFIGTEPDHNPQQLVPWPLVLCSDSESAWISTSIDQALERATLLRLCWGLQAEVKALRCERLIVY